MKQAPLWTGRTFPVRISAVGLLVAAMLVAVPFAHAQTAPADSAIKGAVYDLDRVAKELPRLTPSRKANIKRMERGLKMTEQRLAASGNKQHPSWVEANKRLQQYKAQLARLKNPAPKPAAAPATVQSNTNRGATAASQSQPSSAANAPASTSNRSAEQAAGMPRYERTKFNKLKRDLNSTIASYKKLDPKLLHNGRELKNWRGRINFLNQGYGRFAKYGTDAEVVKVGKVVKALTAHYQQTEKRSLAAFQSLGNIPAGVQKIENYYRQTQMPAKLEPPYTEDRATAWAEYLNQFRAQAARHADWLKKVATTTNEYRIPVRNALNGTIGHRANGAINRAIEDTRRQFQEPLNRIAPGSQVDFASKLTPQDKHKIRNTLLGDGDYERLVSALDEARQAINSRDIIDKALGISNDGKSKQQLAGIASTRQKLDALFETVLGEVRMPKSRSNDPKLVEAVKQAFARQSKPPVYERLVINTEPTTRAESRAWWSGGVATIADYKWTEFQAATAEKVGDKYFIFYNSIHYYTSGSSQTPLNKWIINKRFQSNRILPENIGK